MCQVRPTISSRKLAPLGPVCHGRTCQKHKAPDSWAPRIIGTHKPLHPVLIHCYALKFLKWQDSLLEIYNHVVRTAHKKLVIKTLTWLLPIMIIFNITLIILHKYVFSSTVNSPVVTVHCSTVLFSQIIPPTWFPTSDHSLFGGRTGWSSQLQRPVWGLRPFLRLRLELVLS